MEADGIQDLHRKINLYLDHEMSKDDEICFMNQINTDPESHSILEREMAIRNKIKQKLTRPAVSPQFLEQIKNKISRYPGA